MFREIRLSFSFQWRRGRSVSPLNEPFAKFADGRTQRGCFISRKVSSPIELIRVRIISQGMLGTNKEIYNDYAGHDVYEQWTCGKKRIAIVRKSFASET